MYRLYEGPSCSSDHWPSCLQGQRPIRWPGDRSYFNLKKFFFLFSYSSLLHTYKRGHIFLKKICYLIKTKKAIYFSLWKIGTGEHQLQNVVYCLWAVTVLTAQNNHRVSVCTQQDLWETLIVILLSSHLTVFLKYIPFLTFSKLQAQKQLTGQMTSSPHKSAVGWFF